MVGLALLGLHLDSKFFSTLNDSVIPLNKENKLTWLKLSASLKHQNKVMWRSHLSVHFKFHFLTSFESVAFPFLPVLREILEALSWQDFSLWPRNMNIILFIYWAPPRYKLLLRWRTGCLIWGKSTQGMSCSCRCKCPGRKCKCAALPSVVEDGINPLHPPPHPPLLWRSHGADRRTCSLLSCFETKSRQVISALWRQVCAKDLDFMLKWLTLI